MRRCTKCKLEKDRSEFYRDKSNADGIKSRCKGCVRKYYEDNRGKILEQQRLYCIANPDKRREYSRRAHAVNREKERKYQRLYYAANREKANAATRRWQKENPEKPCIYSARRRARKLAATIGDPVALQARISEIYKEPCVWCGSEDNIHVDHIWPLSKGGAHAAYNLQALCSKCNLQKGDKVLPQLAAAV